MSPPPATGRILIVDDDPATAGLAAMILESAGHAVALAATAQDGLARLCDGKFDLVLLDLYLPGMGGWEVLPRIRERFDAAALPVVVFTAEDNRGVRKTLLGLGANDFIVKPVAPAVLLQTAARWIARDEHEPGAAPPKLAAPREPRGASTSGPDRKRVVVVVDDDPIMCGILTEMVEAVGFSVECAGDAVGCLRIVDALSETGDPAALILDVFMPQTDGIELIRALALRGHRPPLIIISGVDPEYLPLASNLGEGLGFRVLGTLEKPLQRDRLHEYLRAARG